MNAKKRIFIVEDHQLFREGLKAMLSANPTLEVAGESADGLDALKRIQKLKPDLVLLDLTMPRIDGYTVLRDIRRAFAREIKVLVLSIHQADNYVLKAFEAGADGYCVKDSSLEEFRLAIDAILSGRRFISSAVADKVLDGYMSRGQQLKPKSARDSLTQREIEVLKLIAEGYPNKKIAEMLTISPKTVEKHRASLMTKLDIHNAAVLAAYAVELGLVSCKNS